MPKLTGVGMAGNHSVDGAWCTGCGLHRQVTGEHRADCTAFPPGCPYCLYFVNVNGHHRADCTQGDRTA